MTYNPKYAIVKFNGGRGALLCNKCRIIIRADFDPMEIEDKQYLCGLCRPRHRNDPIGPDFFSDNTRDVKECQATFKDYCQWPKCDCDRADKSFIDYDKAQTNPVHGGKIWED